MSDVFYTPPAASLQTERRNQPTFFSVAPAKLIVMMLLTHGLYGLHWLYQNWSTYKRHSGRPILPAVRTILGLFYVPSLFYTIDRTSKTVTGKGMPQWLLNAVLYILLPFSPFIIGFVIGLQKAFTGYEVVLLGFWFDFLVGTAAFVLQTYVVVRVQRVINVVNGDPDGLSNHRYSAANGLWIAIGLVIWIGLTYGAYVKTGV